MRKAHRGRHDGRHRPVPWGTVSGQRRQHLSEGVQEVIGALAIPFTSHENNVCRAWVIRIGQLGWHTVVRHLESRAQEMLKPRLAY